MRYTEGEQIVTNEPCLNCTCHNQMLMCFLKVCPFIKPVGKHCVVEKKPDQCCPTINCPQGMFPKHKESNCFDNVLDQNEFVVYFHKFTFLSPNPNSL